MHLGLITVNKNKQITCIQPKDDPLYEKKISDRVRLDNISKMADIINESESRVSGSVLNLLQLKLDTNESIRGTSFEVRPRVLLPTDDTLPSWTSLEYEMQKLIEILYHF